MEQDVGKEGADKKLPQRKYPRLKDCDYSRSGLYFVTIATKNHEETLSQVIHDREWIERNALSAQTNVGWGLAPTATNGMKWYAGGFGVRLTQLGYIAERELLALEKRFSQIKIDQYVIMPSHIHVILKVCEETKAVGASPHPTEFSEIQNEVVRDKQDCPTIMSVIGTFKSLTTRVYNQLVNEPGQKRFQTSFYDRLIRNRDGYYATCRYIDENPIKWYFGEIRDEDEEVVTYYEQF